MRGTHPVGRAVVRVVAPYLHGGIYFLVRRLIDFVFLTHKWRNRIGALCEDQKERRKELCLQSRTSPFHITDSIPNDRRIVSPRTRATTFEGQLTKSVRITLHILKSRVCNSYHSQPQPRHRYTSLQTNIYEAEPLAMSSN